jgi:hypothetical protein
MKLFPKAATVHTLDAGIRIAEGLRRRAQGL